MRQPGSSLLVIILCAALGCCRVTRDEQLLSAAREGDLESVRIALAAGAQVDAETKDGASALFYAAQYGHPEVVKFLAEQGADVDIAANILIANRAHSVTALAAAALGGYADVVRALLKHGASPPEFLVLSDGLTPYSRDWHEIQRDWEVIASILRTPQVEAITKEITLRDAPGAYQSHDGQKVEIRVAKGDLSLVAADGSVVRLHSFGGSTFAEGSAQDPDRPRQFMERRLVYLPPEECEQVMQQYGYQGGVWLNFMIGEGRVLGLKMREGGPRGLGGPPVLFRKLNARPEGRVTTVLDVGSTVPAPAIPPTNWPQWRGPDASGVADGQAPPTTWDIEDSSSILWKTPIPGLGHSSPIVWGDRIFLTSAVSSKQDPVFRIGNMGDTDSVDDRSSHAWKIFSLDRQTGEVLWERNVHEGLPRGRRHIKSSFANPTPATDGKHVVALFGSEGLYAYDMEGKLLWQRDLGMVGHPAWGFSSSPIIYRDMVIVQCDTKRPSARARQEGVEAVDSFIAAFALADGSERWRQPRDEVWASFASPTIYEGPDGAELITNSGRQIRGYDPGTGEVLWSLAARTGNVTPTPIVAGGLIFVTSGFRPFQPIYAIRLNAAGDISLGEGQEANKFIAWSKSRGGPYTPTPIVYGKYLYTVNVSGILACYEAETGKRAYRTRLHHLGGGISSSPVAADGQIYFSSEGGDVFVVKAGPEFELLATNSLGEVIMATPAVSGGIIFIRTLHHLFAID